MENDLALETLLSVRADLAPDLDERLLRSCYAVQKKHQFDRDRGLSSQAMDRLMDDQVGAVVANPRPKGT